MHLSPETETSDCAETAGDAQRMVALVEAQRQSLEQVASGKPLGEILAFLTGIVEEQSGGQAVAAILLLDAEGKLRIGAAPSLPDSYNRAIDGLKAQAELGTCSHAAVTKQVVVTPDIENDRRWKCIRHLPLALGLKAAWSQPIYARDGRVLGTFGTYFRQCRGPVALERQVVEVLSKTAGLAIERAQADAERERLLANERAARAEADAANRAKDKFLAVLSHELRTPLSPVLMTLPGMEMDPEMPFKFREDLAMMRRNIELEVKLIDDLLDLSRVSTGKLRLRATLVQAHDILRHAIENSAGDASGKQLEVRKDLQAKCDRLIADGARLQQVFWNLVRNAMKFTPEGGKVTVRTWNDKDTGDLMVEVKDTGVGIAMEMLPRVFDAFEQGDMQRARQFGGLGLGLAIAKAVVEMHGGTIEAASDGEGCGASFTVRLKVAAAQETAQIPEMSGAKGRTGHSRGKILLVEDHADTARTMARILSGHGFEVVAAGSVREALEEAGNGAFDILVSDIGLPDGTGYGLMEELKRRHGMRGIALSGYGMEEDVRKGLASGFEQHVVKPVNLDHLQEVIERVLAGV